MTSPLKKQFVQKIVLQVETLVAAIIIKWVKSEGLVIKERDQAKQLYIEMREIEVKTQKGFEDLLLNDEIATSPFGLQKQLILMHLHSSD